MKEQKKPKFLKTDDLNDKLDVEYFFRKWAEENQVSVNYHGALNYQAKPIDDLKSFRARLFLDAKSYSRKLTRDEIDAALDLFMSAERRKAMEEFTERFAKSYDGSGKHLISRFIRAVTGNEREISIAVIRHFIWQVKRRLLGLPIQDHMMPVMVGPQRSGKSTAIKKLLGPLGEMYIGKLVTQLTDEREWEMFRRYPVIVVDEMAQADKACLQTLKYVITTDDRLTYRPMRTNHQETMRPISTFVGTSNVGLEEVIKDRTGNRRFFQIDCLPEMDWAAIDGIDFELVWKSVDAYDQCPIEKHIRLIQEHQKGSTYKASADLYLEDQQIVPDSKHKMLTREIWDDYKKWCEKNGLKPYDCPYFGRELVRLGFKSCKVGHKSERGFYGYSPILKNEEITYEPEVEDADTHEWGPPEPDKLTKWVHETPQKEPS